ncbi:MAG: alpha-L-fucosidase, partial [Lentisphaeria bacterium]|nr:alpha-L-fucosidase [Lentisphaeria bacterium]
MISRLQILLAAATITINAQMALAVEKPTSTVLSKQETLQRAFSENRFGMFICYNIMSYGASWGQANFPIDSFNPKNLDCNQWADAAVSAGMTYGLLTTKHHEGFCLWDSKTTKYDVASTPYKKDIVKQFADAFRKKNLGVGLYYSIWDSTHGVEKGKMDAKKLDFIKEQLTELLTNYGKIDFLFFDGWYWRMGYRQADFSEIRALIRKLQPDCLVA